jgi:hypothetical protein
MLRRYPRWWIPPGEAVPFFQRDDGDAPGDGTSPPSGEQSPVMLVEAWPEVDLDGTPPLSEHAGESAC